MSKRIKKRPEKAPARAKVAAPEATTLVRMKFVDQISAP